MAHVRRPQVSAASLQRSARRAGTVSAVSVVRASIEIAAPPERVWDFIMDPGCFDKWVTIHRKLGDVSKNPLREGSTMDQTLCLRGVNFEVHWKVVELDRPRRAVWTGQGPARSRAEIRNELHPAGDGATRFDYTNEFNPPGGPVGAVAGRVLVGGVSQREANSSLRKLKGLLEK